MGLWNYKWLEAGDGPIPFFNAWLFYRYCTHSVRRRARWHLRACLGAYFEACLRACMEACFIASLRARLRARLGACLWACLSELCLRAVLEKAARWEEQSFPLSAFGLWKTLSLWMLWLIGSESVDALTLALTKPTYLTKCFRNHHHHHHHHHHHEPRTECVCISSKLMRNRLQIPLRKLSRRSALPEIQLSTFSAESEPAIVNTMTLRHHEILSWWPL